MLSYFLFFLPSSLPSSALRGDDDDDDDVKKKKKKKKELATAPQNHSKD
jgi:hypothetical protein